MLSRGDETIAYTAFDKPYALTNANGETTKFYYDGNNNRYKKKTSSYETLYLDKIYERKLYSSSGTDEYTGYFYFGDKLVAMQILQGESKTKSYRYVHTDSLDSISLITDENGDIVEQRSYEPFGEIRSIDYGNGIVPANTTNITNRSFTNHEQIGEMEGLIHMDGRVYDSTIGRFLSADIHVPHPYSTQSYNRYSYVRNNPLGFTDPSGYTDEENAPTNTSPDNKRSQRDATPNGSGVPQTGTNLPVAAASVNGADMLNGADMVKDLENKQWVYVPSSLEIQAKRKKELEKMYNMVQNIKTKDKDFMQIQKILREYHKEGRITYWDSPYLNENGEFNKNKPLDALFRGAYRAAITSTSPNGRGIQYTSLIWEESWGNGYMSEQFIRTYLHEPIHDRTMMKGGHTPEYNNLATRKEDDFYIKENNAVEIFYNAYPQYNTN